MKFTEEELEKIKKERMEQIDRWLDNEYGCSYTRLEELHDFAIEQDMKHQEEKDKEIERLKDDNKYLNKVNIELSSEKNRLNNIINAIEKLCIDNLIYDELGMKVLDQPFILDKINELKGSDKE